jgi:hypothetical protein
MALSRQNITKPTRRASAKTAGTFGRDVGPQMIIKLSKAKNASKPDTLTCMRDDATHTWWPLAPHFAEHDLLHYAVETTLGLEQAFYGLIAGGRDISDFGTRDGQKDFYPPDAIRAEFIVGLLQSQMSDSILAEDAACLDAINLTAEKMPAVPSLQLSEEELIAIRARMEELVWQWRNLEAGESIELPFDLSKGSRSILPAQSPRYP